MKTALVHDWLYIYGGAERVMESMLRSISVESIYTLVDFLPENYRFILNNIPIVTSFLQNMPFAHSRRRSYLPIMPLAIESLDVSAFDLVISSSSAMAKGVLTHSDQLHICYCNNLTQYAWDLTFQYLKKGRIENGLRGFLARLILHYIRLWDISSANRVDHFVANSRHISRGIWKRYRRESTIIYPPVEIDLFELESKKDEYYITASRFVPYKNVDVIIDAFSNTNKRLVVAGDGPELKKILSKATKNIEIIGYKTKQELSKLFMKAKAFIYAADEAFGIVTVEAQACGTPVIAYGHGGSIETIKGVFVGEKPDRETTGIFFGEQTAGSLSEAIQWFERHQGEIEPANCRRNAERFSRHRFEEEFSQFVADKWEAFQSARGRQAKPAD